MSGWFVLLILLGMAVAGAFLLGVRGAMLRLVMAALCLGAAGYALQARPALEGAPRAGVVRTDVVPLTQARRAFYGQFTPHEHWLIISDGYARRGKTADAVGVLKNAVEKYPRDASLWVGLGNALVDHAGMITPAADFAFRRAAALSPGYPAPPFFLGLALARTGDREGALRLWREVLADAPAEASWRPLVEDAVAALGGAGGQQARQSPRPVSS